MNNRGIWQDYLGWWIMALVVLVVGLIAYGAFSGKLGDMGRFLEGIFRFGQ